MRTKRNHFIPCSFQALFCIDDDDLLLNVREKRVYYIDKIHKYSGCQKTESVAYCNGLYSQELENMFNIFDSLEYVKIDDKNYSVKILNILSIMRQLSIRIDNALGIDDTKNIHVNINDNKIQICYTSNKSSSNFTNVYKKYKKAWPFSGYFCFGNKFPFEIPEFNIAFIPLTKKVAIILYNLDNEYNDFINYLNYTLSYNQAKEFFIYYVNKDSDIVISPEAIKIAQ